MANHPFDIKARTGFPGLDAALLGVRLGDNVVFQIDDIEAYRLLARKYVTSALEDGYQVIYFRFASHSDLLADIHPQSEESRTVHMQSDAAFKTNSEPNQNTLHNYMQ